MDSATGRFLQEDPISGFLNLPISQNKYPYTLNNPVNFTDPNGEIFQNLILFCGQNPAVCTQIGIVIVKEIVDAIEGRNIPTGTPPTSPIQLTPDLIDKAQDFIERNKVKPRTRSGSGNCPPGKRMTSRGCRDTGETDVSQPLPDDVCPIN